MALSDTWLTEFEEAMKLADDIALRLRERENLVSSGGDSSHLTYSTRRKITVLGTCLDRLESLLQNPPEKCRLTDDELYRRQDMLLGIRFKTKQMASSLSTSPSNRATPSLEERIIKRTTDPARGTDTDRNVNIVSPKKAMYTQHHAIIDVAEDTSMRTHLLSEENAVPELQPKSDDNKELGEGCTFQLSCLIFLGVLALLLVVWTIIRIW